jgi:hypothetical protein
MDIQNSCMKKAMACTKKNAVKPKGSRKAQLYGDKEERWNVKAAS